MTDYTPLGEYEPLKVTIVVHRLKGEPLPPELDMARMFPCMDCGAPPGFACKNTSERCWRARLLDEKQWRAVQKAYNIGRGSGVGVNGFMDSVYQGFNAQGMLHKDPDGAQDAMRKLRVGPNGAAVVEMIKAVLESRGKVPF